MATLDREETLRRVKSITADIQKSDWEGVENGLLDVLIQIQKDHQELSENTPRNHDIAALIQEMRNGFAAMDRRFEAMDKRFDDLIHQMDKRFEQVDKRFAQVDKRFEQVDKRFDDLIHQMDKRFNTIQWFMGIGFTFFAFILTYGTFFK